MKMKLFSWIFFWCGCAFSVSAQHHLTLRQAVETGLQNNFDVLQADLQMQKEGISLKQSRLERLPDLNASANHGVNYGRSIDPFTNSFINQKVGYASYGASSNILLFNGLSMQNQIRSRKLGFEASQQELQQAKDNLTINIILSYLEVLSAGDVLKQSQELETSTQKQVDRLKVLHQSGAILPSDYFNLKGQLATDQINISNNKASLETAKLNLAQLLNIPYDKDLEVERLPEKELIADYSGSPEEVYATALKQFAQIKAARLRTESARKNISSLKGQLFPTLSLGGNVNTNYSSVATRDYFVNTTEIASPNYVEINGIKSPVIVQQNNYDSRKIHFGDQLSNNLFSTINLGLTIPLFNAGRIRNQVKLAKLDLKSNELAEKNSKTQLQQSIERVYVELTSAVSKYKLLQDQVASFEESFRTTEIRFNAGAITSVDYLIAKNNLDAARGNLIMAKYDLALREKVLDYYCGRNLW